VAAPVADSVVLAIWITVVLVDLVALAHEREPRRRLGPAVVGGRRPPHVLVVLLVLLAGIGFVLLERRTSSLAFRPAVAVLGLILMAAGLVLHASARRTLGPLWSGVITVRADHAIVERGPYRLVRHPIYASFLLLAAGSLLVHPSVAVACAALGCTAGIVLKIGFEERALRRALGEPYRRYAARVPALVPRLRRRGREAPGTDCPGT